MLCDLPINRDRWLATQRSSIMVTSARTGECIALLDGRAVTAIRTAAASAVATDYLARRSSPVLGLVGAGNLAIEHAHAIAAVRDVERIVVWTRSTATLHVFRAGVEGLGIPVESAPSADAVVAAADIVCTLTPAREPVVLGSWLRASQHVNAVGAPPRPDHREVDAEAMGRARVVVDSHATTMAKSGGVLLAIAEGLITEDDVRTELGGVIVGTQNGRRSDDDITLFESVGVGLQDLATAELVIAARRNSASGSGSTSERDGDGILGAVDSVLQFAGNFWWLIFPLGGVIGGGVRAVTAANERRAERRLERFRIKQQTKIAMAEASGRGKVDEATARREVGKVLAQHDRIDNRWLDYEMDVAKLLDFPLMTDMREPLTAEFHRARSRADLLRPASADDLTVDRDAQLDYRDAVHDYASAFDVAESEAVRRRRSDFTVEAQERLERAQRLLRVASDEAATTQERQSAYSKAQRELDGLIVLPALTRAGIERRIAGELKA